MKGTTSQLIVVRACGHVLTQMMHERINITATLECISQYPSILPRPSIQSLQTPTSQQHPQLLPNFPCDSHCASNPVHLRAPGLEKRLGPERFVNCSLHTPASK